MAASDPTFVLKQLEPGDRVSGLSLGDPIFTPLKTFVKKQAKTFEEQSLARTYCIYQTDLEHPKLAAYITLVNGEISADEEEEGLVAPEIGYTYSHYPAVKIARLAVDTKYQGLGLGRRLVDLALGKLKDHICPHVGCRFLVVDSKKPAVPFYRKCGFTMLNTAENRERENPVMFIDMYRIRL